MFMQNEYAKIFEFIKPYTNRTEFSPVEIELKTFRKVEDGFFEDESKFLFIAHVDEHGGCYSMDNKLSHKHNYHEY